MSHPLCARLGTPQVQLETSEPELTKWLQQRGLAVETLKVRKRACYSLTAGVIVQKTGNSTSQALLVTMTLRETPIPYGFSELTTALGHTCQCSSNSSRTTPLSGCELLHPVPCNHEPLSLCLAGGAAAAAGSGQGPRSYEAYQGWRTDPSVVRKPGALPTNSSSWYDPAPSFVATTAALTQCAWPTNCKCTTGCSPCSLSSPIRDQAMHACMMYRSRRTHDNVH